MASEQPIRKLKSVDSTEKPLPLFSGGICRSRDQASHQCLTSRISGAILKKTWTRFGKDGHNTLFIVTMAIDLDKKNERPYPATALLPCSRIINALKNYPRLESGSTMATRAAAHR